MIVAVRDSEVMRIAMACLVLVLACGGTASKPAGAGSPSSAPPPTKAAGASNDAAGSAATPEHNEASAAPTIDPAPPPGVVIPRGVRVVSAEAGGPGYSWYWKATLAADPADADLRARIEQARAAGHELTLGTAALARHREDVEAAGHAVTGFAFMPGFDYDVKSERGPLAVFVRVPADDPHGGPRDPSVAVADEHGPYFEITVGPAGG
jgi:hypothetical protein